MKSFVAKIEPAKDHLIQVTDTEIKRLIPIKQDTTQVLSATDRILQASIPIIQETGNFAQSKQLQQLTNNLKELRTIIAECSTDSTA